MRPAARQRRPRPRRARAGLGWPLPRGTEPPRSSAGGASFPRPLRLAPLFSPGPLRPAAEPRRPLRSARGFAPRTWRRGQAGVLPAVLGPSILPGKGLHWSPRSGIRGGAAGSPQPAGVFRAVRSTAGNPLPAPFSRALPLSLLLSHLLPSFSHFSVPQCLFTLPFLCLLAVSAPTLCLPHPFLSLLPCLSSCSVALCLFLPLPFSFPFPALLFFLFSFLSSLPFQLPYFPLLYPFPSRPASLSGPWLSSVFPLPSRGEGLSGVCLFWGTRGAATATCGVPHTHTAVAQEEREETVVGRVLSSTLPLSPS